MFILEKPYVSEFLIDSIVRNNWAVLDNIQVKEADVEEGAFTLWNNTKAKNYYLQQEYPLIYSNSENAISWISDNLPKSNLNTYIRLFKDKVSFREMLKKLYPDFYFEAVDYNMLHSLNPQNIHFPIVLKPAVGFLSFGVHTVKNVQEWNEVLQTLQKEMQIASSLYPENVINSSKFILEELIEGDEFAIDAYYNRDGDAIILNIFQHPFLDEKDVSDRIYIMSVEIMVKYMAKFAQLLREIGQMNNIRNFPFHIEVRVTKNGRIIPIEVNPMRFAGWCTTDVAKYAWGINVYECFHNHTRPDWTKILSSATKDIYYFSMAEVPTNIAKTDIKGFNYDGFLSNYSNILEVRRINPKNNPLFAIIFGSTNNHQEINKILGLKTADYIIK